jgi:hypothetical protein
MLQDGESIFCILLPEDIVDALCAYSPKDIENIMRRAFVATGRGKDN